METNTTNQGKPKSKMRTIACLPQIICIWLFGVNHSDTHKICTGLVIVGIGTVLLQIPVGNAAVKICQEACGMSLHGIGLAPAIEKMAVSAKKNTEKEEQLS